MVSGRVWGGDGVSVTYVDGLYLDTDGGGGAVAGLKGDPGDLRPRRDGEVGAGEHWLQELAVRVRAAAAVRDRHLRPQERSSRVRGMRSVIVQRHACCRASRTQGVLRP